MANVDRRNAYEFCYTGIPTGCPLLAAKAASSVSEIRRAAWSHDRARAAARRAATRWGERAASSNAPSNAASHSLGEPAKFTTSATSAKSGNGHETVGKPAA